MSDVRRVTLKDIAKETGYTINTISRALKDRPDISESAKARIREVADRMGYIHDTVAGSLRSGSTRTIAVILSDISNPFLAMQVKAIELSAMKQGYSTLILNTDENSDAERRAILTAYGKKVDGILLCPVQKDEENVRFLQKAGVPFVLIGRHFKNIETDAVYSNDTKAGFLAAEYLISQGHRNILYIGGQPYISSEQERLQGIHDACRRAGIPADNLFFHHVDMKIGSARQTVEDAISGGLRFTAVIAFSDMLGMEARCALLEKLGGDAGKIPIVGFDNIQSRLPIPLDFISVGMSGMDWAKPALRLLLNRIQNHTAQDSFKKTIIDVKIKHYRY